MLLDTLQLSSSDELLRKFASHNVSVPSRGSGQTKDHREIWVASRFLCTIASSAYFTYPLRVEFSDRPDLILEFERGESKSIGIEITEAISQNAAKLQAELERDGRADICHHVPEHKYSDSRQDLETQRNIVLGDIASPPIMGNAVERNWYVAIREFVCKKTEKIMHPDFRRFPENWLLIYDNWSPSPPYSEVQRIINQLSQDLFASDRKQPFDRVFILDSEIMWECRKDVTPISYQVVTPS